MPEIKHLLKINVPPDRVYQALSTSDGIREWWTRDADLDNTIGGCGEFRFRYPGGKHVTEVKVTELTPPVRVSWQIVSSFRPAWIGTTVTFVMRPDDNGTSLLFSHGPWTDADDEYALCTTGWGYYLVSLQQYLQTGKGAPSPEVDFAIVLNAR